MDIQIEKEVITGFIEKVVGKPFEEIGNIAQDWMKYFRYKNLLLIYDKVEKIQKRRGIEGKSKAINPRIAIPLLESASIENEGSIQELWAKIIANGTDSQKKIDIHPAFIEVIKQLSPDEARILIEFGKLGKNGTIYSDKVEIDINDKQQRLELGAGLYQSIKGKYLYMCEGLALNNLNYCLMYLDNLSRLRIIEFENIIESKKDICGGNYPGDNIIIGNSGQLVIVRSEKLRFTEFGEEFLKACLKDD